MTVAIDGCSALSIRCLYLYPGLAYKNLVTRLSFDEKRRQACLTIVNAMGAYPLVVAGTDRYCTDMLTVCGKRIIGKTGAEEVYSHWD